jgi:hypothetical protein
MNGRLQRERTPQILFIGVFSTNGNAVFLFNSVEHQALSIKHQELSIKR